MIDTQTKKRWVSLFIWVMAGFALLIILTSCSPLSTLPTSQPTAAPIPSKTPEIPTAPIFTATQKPVQSCQVRTGIPAGYLNLRTGAGVSHAVIRVLAEGETMQVIKRGTWLQVIDEKGNRGFINARYCEVEP